MASPMARLGFTVSPAGTGTYSKPVQANRPAKAAANSPGDSPVAGAGAACRLALLTKKSPTPTKATSPSTLMTLMPSPTRADGLSPTMLTTARNATTNVTAVTSTGTALPATDEKRGMDGEAARHARVAEQRRDHRDPADREANQRPERLDSVAIRARPSDRCATLPRRSTAR